MRSLSLAGGGLLAVTALLLGYTTDRRKPGLSRRNRHVAEHRQGPAGQTCGLTTNLGKLLRAAEPRHRSHRALRASSATENRITPIAPREHGPRSLFKVDRLDESIAAFREALAIRPRHGLAHYNLAIALTRKGEIAKAIQHYRAALEVDPGLTEAHYNLAKLLGEAGQFRRECAAVQAGPGSKTRTMLSRTPTWPPPTSAPADWTRPPSIAGRCYGLNQRASSRR